MYSSPVRRFTNVLLRLLARLACIRRAASVRSEPGSNSQIGITSEFGPRATTSIHLHHCSTFSIQLSKNRRTHHASRALYSVHRKGVKGPFYQTYSRVFPRTACPHRTLAHGQQAGSQRTRDKLIRRPYRVKRGTENMDPEPGS